MKLFKWIASNKIVIFAPLLTLITAVVLAYAYKWNEDRKTNPEAAQSYPTPTIKTVDKQEVGKQEIARAAEDSPVTAEMSANIAKVVLDVDPIFMM